MMAEGGIQAADKPNDSPAVHFVDAFVGGIHGKNRLMGNSLLDIIVFGRTAGRNAAERAKTTTVGALTLDHVEKFEQALRSAGIETDAVSPKLLPDYTRHKK